MKSVFKIENFNLYYGDFHAVKDITMEIPKNKVTALIGPSGCGKSSFLRCMNRMNDFVENARMEGKLEYENQDISNIDVQKLRLKVGMVFQKPTPFHMSIYENIAYGLRCSGINNKQILDKKVEDALKKAALWDEVKENLKKSALQLSGGQQQRLCIARAIVMEPDVILMDEPTSALDPIATKKIENLIEELKKEFTIIIVTHSMQQAARISDYTAFLLLGELIEFENSKKFFSMPADKRSEDYITGRFG